MKEQRKIRFRWMIPYKGGMVRYSNNYKTQRECYDWLINYKRCVGDTLQDTSTFVLGVYTKPIKEKQETI
jgi:hypothetical protein